MKLTNAKFCLTALLLSMTATATLTAQISITVVDNVPNGTASGGTGSGAGLLTTTAGNISSNIGLPVMTYTVSNLDFTSIGGTASESFTFSVTFTATSDGSTPASVQFAPFGNVGVTGGSNSNLVDGSETLTATIALTGSSFAGLSLDGMVTARAGGAAGGNTGTITWATGSFAVSTGNTVATINPADGITAFTITVDPTRTLNFEGFSAQFTAIPEPSTYAALIGLGALGFVAARRRRQVVN